MSEATDYDGAWKETIELYLRPFLELCFPEAAAGIDWRVPVEFLDQELQEIVRDADLGKQRVDKLIKVQRLDGGEEWVLVHVEVQGQPDPDLPRRLYRYHHRVEDRFGRRVVNLVVLADEQPGWRPSVYEEELWGCRLRFEYPLCKLLDLAEQPGRLDDSDTRSPSWWQRIWPHNGRGATWSCATRPSGTSPAGCTSAATAGRTSSNCSG